MVSWGFSRVKIVRFISHNNQQDANKHWLILCALVKEGCGREKSKFVFLLLFFLLLHYCHGPSSFTVRWLFYYLYFCISAVCIRLLKAALTCDAFKILLRFEFQTLWLSSRLKSAFPLVEMEAGMSRDPVCLEAFLWVIAFLQNCLWSECLNINDFCD